MTKRMHYLGAHSVWTDRDLRRRGEEVPGLKAQRRAEAEAAKTPAAKAAARAIYLRNKRMAEDRQREDEASLRRARDRNPINKLSGKQSTGRPR
jgi:hypothetical protein